MANFSVEDFKVRLELSQSEVVDGLARVQEFLHSEGPLKSAWASFQEKLLYHLKLIDEIISLPDAENIFLKPADHKILEFLKFNLKDLKVKLLFLLDKYMPHAKFANFPSDFSSFAADVLAEIKIEKTYLRIKA